MSQGLPPILRPRSDEPLQSGRGVLRELATCYLLLGCMDTGPVGLLRSAAKVRRPCCRRSIERSVAMSFFLADRTHMVAGIEASVNRPRLALIAYTQLPVSPFPGLRQPVIARGHGYIQFASNHFQNARTC